MNPNRLVLVHQLGCLVASCLLVQALVAAEPARLATTLEVVTVASGERTTIHRGEGNLEAPHFSADGTAVWFNGGGRLYRLALAAGAQPETVDTGFAKRCINDHGLSPDGTQLVISDLTETGKSLMYLLPVAGGTPQRVAAPAPALWHGWSPDGKTLTYCAERERNYDVYAIPVAGGPEKRLTTNPGNDNGPDYSADGQWIYFHSFRDGGVQVWRLHPDGTGEEQVTRDGFYNWFPHPSPDGRWILVLSSKVVPETGHPPPGEYVLRLLPVAGGEPRELTRFTGGNGSLNVPCWSRDSTRIAFAAYTFAP
jgi:TolB protein